MQFIKKTLGEVIRNLAAEMPDAEAVKYTTCDFCRSWKQFDEETDKVAKSLMALGVNKGDKVAIWATNIPQWLLILFGSAKCGAIQIIRYSSLNICFCSPIRKYS